MTVGPEKLPFIGKVRGMPTAAWVLFGGIFVNKFGNFLSIFLVLFLTSEGYSAGQAGLAVGLIGLGNVLGNAIGGAMADALGRRMAIIVSMVGSGTGTLLVPFVPDLGLLCVLVTTIGIFAQLYRPASGATLLDVVPADRRVTAFAIYRLAINLGMAGGPIVAGYLSAGSYNLVFFFDAMSSFGYALIVLLFLPETMPERCSKRSRPPARLRMPGAWGDRFRARPRQPGSSPTGFRTVFRDRGFVLFLIAIAAESFVYLQTTATLPLHIHDAGLGPEVYGWVLGTNAILIVLFELPLTHLIEHCSRRLVVSSGLLLLTTGVAAIGFADTMAWIFVTVLMWTAGEMLFAPTAESIPGAFAPPALRGRYQGSYGLAFSIGVMVGPAIGGLLYDLDPAYTWAGAAVSGYLATLLIFTSITVLRSSAPSIGEPAAAEKA